MKNQIDITEQLEKQFSFEELQFLSKQLPFHNAVKSNNIEEAEMLAEEYIYQKIWQQKKTKYQTTQN